MSKNSVSTTAANHVTVLPALSKDLGDSVALSHRLFTEHFEFLTSFSQKRNIVTMQPVGYKGVKGMQPTVKEVEESLAIDVAVKAAFELMEWDRPKPRAPMVELNYNKAEIINITMPEVTE